MALIRCPECGQEVSDKAIACPRCAYPIAKSRPNGTVKVKITKEIQSRVNIFETDTKRSLWQGRGGSVAEFSVDCPTRVSVSWGLSKTSSHVDKNNTFIAEAGEKYEVTFGGFMGTTILIRKVDYIDSGF